MIVIEGPDGSGKSTLLSHLQKALPHIDTHERFSTSVGGPVESLDIRVATDMKALESRAPQFYDRHPLISEFIYGPIIRNEIKDGLDQIEMTTFKKKFFREALIIVCLPRIETVMWNVHQDPDNQMAGVLPNIVPIYEAYNNLLRYRAFHTMIWYDYEQHSTQFVEERVQAYYERKKAQRGIA